MINKKKTHSHNNNPDSDDDEADSSTTRIHIHPFPDFSTSIHHIHRSMPLPASKCFMALVVSVLCAVSPRITVDTSLISLCTSKNRELRKLTTPVRSGGGSGRGAFSSRSSKVKSIPMVTYPIWFIMFIFLYFTFVKK